MDNLEENIYSLVQEANPDNPIQFVTDIVRPLAKAKLDNYIIDCNDCGICNCTKTRTKGNPNASIMIIGESSTEDQQFEEVAEPFENQSGELLNRALDKLNINRDELFFINSVNCFPHRMDGDLQIKRSPTKTERTNCKVFLDYALKIVQPLVIICLGGVATNGINEEIGKQNISKIRGSYFMYRGIDVMPTYHPGYFLELEKSNLDEDYITELQWDFFNDLEKVFDDFHKKYPDIQIYN